MRLAKKHVLIFIVVFLIIGTVSLYFYKKSRAFALINYPDSDIGEFYSGSEGVIGCTLPPCSYGLIPPPPIINPPPPGWTLGVPPGLAFGADGVLSGIPNTVGDYVFASAVYNSDMSVDTSPVVGMKSIILGSIVLTEIHAIGVTTDATPEYVFNSDSPGTITYGGSCSSVSTSAIQGDNPVVFDRLAYGLYTDCTITVADGFGRSATLNISPFTIKGPSQVIGRVGGGGGGDSTVSPVISQPEPPPAPTNEIPADTYTSPLDDKQYPCKPLNKYIKLGLKDNDSNEVKLWQAFLNKNYNENLNIDGIYGVLTFDAIKRFQNLYKNEILKPWGLENSTGWIYQTTRIKGNKILGCSEGKVLLDNGFSVE